MKRVSPFTRRTAPKPGAAHLSASFSQSLRLNHKAFFPALLMGLSVAPAMAQTAPPAPNATLIIKPPPVPTGVIPLPQGAPPTGQQAPVPPPAQPLPKSDQPLRFSPNLEAVRGYVQNRDITLQDAVAIALYTNRSLASALTSLQTAQARTGQARSALNPTLDARANLNEFDAPTTANFGGQSITLNPQFNPILNATFSLPLDIAGTLHSAVSQAQFQEVAAKIDINRVRNEVVYNVKNAFYNVLRAQAQVAVATDTLNNALFRLSDANKKYAAGTSPRFDVISAQRDVADAQQGLINARAQVSVSLAGLKNTIGLDIKSKLRISDKDAVSYPTGVEPPVVPPVGPNGQPMGSNGTPAPPSSVTPLPTTPLPSMTITPVPAPPTGEAEDTFEFGPEYDALLQEAMKTRPEVLEADTQIAAAQKGVQYARRSSLPTVSVGLGYTYTPNAPEGFARVNQGEAVLGVSFPIFDGGLARERVREARAGVAGAEVNRRQAADQVQVDVQQAYVTLVQARNRVAVANVGLSQAREAYRLARVRYNAGVSQSTEVSPQLEISSAQTSLAQAQSNQVNALYDYNNARAQLDRAVGRYSYTNTAPGYPTPPAASVTGRPK